MPLNDIPLTDTLFLSNPLLKVLKCEGFCISLFQNSGGGTYLVIGHVPYLNSFRKIHRSILLFPLRWDDINSQKLSVVSSKPLLLGYQPCDASGENIKGYEERENILKEVKSFFISHYSLPTDSRCYELSRNVHRTRFGEYNNYFTKVLYHVDEFHNFCIKIDQRCLPARNYGLDNTSFHLSPIFLYDFNRPDNSGVDVTSITSKLSLDDVAVVGVGGTGSFIVDFLSRLPISRIHLFDSDDVAMHNLLRMPGAFPEFVIKDKLNSASSALKKVYFLEELYSPLRRGIIPYPFKLDDSNLDFLKRMSFVFVAVDDGPSRKSIVEYLSKLSIKFVVASMGLKVNSDSQTVGGSVDVVYGPNDKIHKSLNYGDTSNSVYDSNIQFGDLNCLAAFLAIQKFKICFEFYDDMYNTLEEHSSYFVGNQFIKNGSVSDG